MRKNCPAEPEAIFKKVGKAVFVCFAGSVLAQHQSYQGPLAGGQPASLYPAGINPQSCPNYPDCSNPLYQAPVAATPAPVSQYNPVYPQQYAPAAQSQYSSDVQQRLDRGEYIGDGDYRGEGLAEALAPGYAGQAQAAPVNQYNPAPAPQYNSAPAYQPAPQQYSAPAQPAQIPAGVNAQACPNYPFCHA
ncbi:hypothetical protein YQE_12583, partial [Dendroctonus ponderosae]